MLRNSYLSTGLGLEYDYYENVKVSFNVGGIFSHRLEYDDGAGKVIPDGGVYGAVGLVANF